MTALTKKIALAFAASTMAVTATPALADPPSWAPAHGHRAKAHYDRYDRDDRRYDRRDRQYDNHGRYYEPRRINSQRQMWRGDDGRYYCRRDNGTTGLVIGAAVGGLAGHEIAGRNGDRTLGAILGAAAGGLLGRAIDRGEVKCR